MATESQKSDRRTQLLRQHLNEWNDNLALEVKHRQDLEYKHAKERSYLYLSEINYHERARSITQQLLEIKQLASQNREIRISIRKRHTQETDDLNNELT